MPTKDPVGTLKRRALRHLFEDGSFDLVLGFFTFIVGIATQRRFFVALFVVYLAGLTSTWKALHARLTSRRTGYAEPVGNPSGILFGATVMAGILPLGVVAASTLATGSLWNLEHWPSWAAVVSGVTLAAGSLYAYLACRLPRYAVFAILAIAGSVFFWRFPFGASINPSDRLTLFLLSLAAVQMATGAAAMASFVRRYPEVAEDAAHGH